MCSLVRFRSDSSLFLLPTMLDMSPVCVWECAAAAPVPPTPFITCVHVFIAHVAVVHVRWIFWHICICMHVCVCEWVRRQICMCIYIAWFDTVFYATLISVNLQKTTQSYLVYFKYKQMKCNCPIRNGIYKYYIGYLFVSYHRLLV